MAAAAPLAIAVAVGIGIYLRLEDPLSTEVIPAEDPYTHMSLVREHLRDGNMDALYAGGEMYPPGLHSVLAAAWVYTGTDLYEIIRIGPVVFGALGVMGVGLLVARFHASRVDALAAAGVAALAFALAPEIIFRTTMMSPTALDLAVLPFFLYSLLAVLQGRLWWAALAAPMAAFLVFAHPWVFGILSLAGAGFAILALVLPWGADRGPAMSTRGLAIAIVVVGTSLAMALRGCVVCGMGFGFVAGESEAAGYIQRWPEILWGSWVVGALLGALSLKLPVLRGLHWTYEDRNARLIACAIVSVAFAIALWAVRGPAYAQGLPPYVDLGRMFGPPIMVLAALGWIVLPFARSPASILGGAIAATTYPFVIYNPLDSPFWSHRTAAYLGIGLVILAGVGVAAAARAAATAAAWSRQGLSAQDKRSRLPRSMAIAVPGLLVALLLTGGVYAATPGAYEGGWYRLFQECDFDALQEVADKANERPDAFVITADWQSKLVLAAMTEDGGRVWFLSGFFSGGSQPDRDSTLAWLESERYPVYVVLDDYAPAGADTAFLENDSWRPMPAGTCSAPTEPATVRVWEATWGEAE